MKMGNCHYQQKNDNRNRKTPTISENLYSSFCIQSQAIITHMWFFDYKFLIQCNFIV